MNKEKFNKIKDQIIKKNTPVRPFEARLIDEELKAKVLYFQILLAEKSKPKSKKSKIKFNVPKQYQ